MRGAIQTGNVLTVIFSDARHKHYKTFLFDIHSHEFKLGYEFEMDKFDFLNYFERNKQLNIVSIKDKSSLIEVSSFDTAGHSVTKQYDFGNVDFNGDEKVALSYLMEDENQGVFGHEHRVDLINPGEYISDITTRYTCKMYPQSDELFITINWHITLTRTQVLRLNLKTGAQEYYNVPYAISEIDERSISSVNSFLYGHKLFNILAYDKSMIVGIYDLDLGKYIHQWGPSQNSIDSLIGSPLLSEDIGKGKIDTILTTKKYFSKAKKFSIAVNDNGNGGVDLFIGEPIDNSGGGGGMGGGGMTMMGVPRGGMGMPTFTTLFVPGIPFIKGSTPDVVKHRYFWGAIDTTTYLRSTPSKRVSTYRKYEDKLHELKSFGQDDDITLVNYGSYFYLGTYYPDQHVYIFRRYQ